MEGRKTRLGKVTKLRGRGGSTLRMAVCTRQPNITLRELTTTMNLRLSVTLEAVESELELELVFLVTSTTTTVTATATSTTATATTEYLTMFLREVTITGPGYY